MLPKKGKLSIEVHPKKTKRLSFDPNKKSLKKGSIQLSLKRADDIESAPPAMNRTKLSPTKGPKA